MGFLVECISPPVLLMLDSAVASVNPYGIYNQIKLLKLPTSLSPKLGRGEEYFILNDHLAAIFAFSLV